jgi:O-antigen ligase
VLTAGSRALPAQAGLPARAAWDGPAIDGRWLLVAGLATVGLFGAAVPRLGAGTAVALFVGGTALVAAVASSYAALALLIVLILVPLGAAGELPAHVNEIDTVYGAALLGLALRTLTSRETPTLSPLSLALAAFILVGVLTLAAGVLGTGEAATALGQFRGLFGYALIPLLVLSMGDQGRERRRTLLYLLCAVGALTAARGVLSWAHLNDVIQLSGALRRIASPDSEELVGAVPALSGDFGYLRAWAGNFEGNTLGAFVILLLPITTYLAMRGGNSLVRTGFGAGALLLAVALLVSYSRGAYLGLAGASVPAMFTLWRRHPLGAIALALVGGVLLYFLATQLPGAEDRLATLRTLGDDPTVRHRQIVYAQIVDSVAANPVWGVGLGSSVGTIGTGADSLYLFMVLRGGLLLTSAFLLLIWTAGRKALGALRAGLLTNLDLAVAAGLLGFAVHSVIDYTLWNPKVALTVWLLIGVLMAAVVENRRSMPTPAPDAHPATPKGEKV